MSRKTDAVAGGDKGTVDQYNFLRDETKMSAFLLASATSTLKLYIHDATVYFRGTKVDFTGGLTPVMAAPAASSRIDIVSMASSSEIIITSGVEADSPSAPTAPEDDMVICEVYNRAGQVEITDTDEAGSNGYINKDLRPALILEKHSSITVKGIVEEATAAEINAGTQEGASGADLAVNPKYLKDSEYYTLRRTARDLTYGETIAGDTLPVPVFQDTSDNEVYACDANTTSRIEFLGFATDDGNDGDSKSVQFTGIVPGFSGLDEGEDYYVQDAVGTIGKTPGTRKILVGKAISTTELLILKREIENNHFVGAGDNSPKDYWNFVIPFSYGGGANEIWDQVSQGTFELRGSWVSLAPSVDSGNYVLTDGAIFMRPTGTSVTRANFSATDVIVEFGARLSGTLINDNMGFGLTNVLNAFQDYDNQVADAACFTVADDGKLYAHTSNAGVGHTEVEITGITLNNLNTYRIEFDHGVEARFYVNGVLKATIATNLPDSTDIKFGCGSSGNTIYVIQMTAPQFSVKK